MTLLEERLDIPALELDDKLSLSPLYIHEDASYILTTREYTLGLLAAAVATPSS